MSSNESLNQRREQRYSVCSGAQLLTETFIEFDEPIDGTVIDISSHGLRLLCLGSFRVDQAFVTELKTDRLHGVFPGVIRHIEPWVDGKSVLGCELLEPIPDDVLETLAREHAIDRRSDDRVAWNRPAKMSWELQAGEVDVEVQDCSRGGLKVTSQSSIPDDVCVRVRIHVDNGEEVVVDARRAWQIANQDGCSAGLSFTKRELPKVIMELLAGGGTQPAEETLLVRSTALRPSVMIAAAVVIGAAMLWQSSL